MCSLGFLNISWDSSERSLEIEILLSFLGKSDSADSKLDTTHQNQISNLQIQEGDKNSAKVVSSVAGDGRLVSWNLANLETLMKGLEI